MSATHPSTERGSIVTRLHRAEGQVRGLAHMVEDGRPCVEVLTQIAAVHGALDGVAAALLDECARHAFAEAAPAEAVDELLAAIELLGRRR